MPKKHALILANTEYRDAKLAPLSAPGQGYADLAEAMKDPARGAFAQVETLVNGNLSQVLHSLDRFFSRRPAEDFLLVYFCGHGLVDPQGDIFLSLRDSDRYRLKSTALMAAVLGMNMDLCPSPHKALILDCRFHAMGHGAGTPPRINPAKVFAGRGLPKVIFTGSDAVEWSGRMLAPEDRPSPEFTRVLAECLRPPAGAAGKQPFTLADWWNSTLAPFKASGQPNAPRLHAVGNPPETVLRGVAIQVPEMAMFSDVTAPRASDAVAAGPGHPAGPFDPGDGGPMEEQQWSRLSGIFPLEMIAPELAIPQPTPPLKPESDGESVDNADTSSPWDLRVPPSLDGSPTLMWDRQSLNEAMKASEPPETTPRDTFADLRARLLKQEEEEKQALLDEEEEEAVQRDRLEQWKARWENRREASEKPDEGAAENPQAVWSHLAELQKTIFFGNPEREAEGPSAITQEYKTHPVGFPTGDGLATVMVSREEFLGPAARKPSAPAETDNPPVPAAESTAALALSDPKPDDRGSEDKFPHLEDALDSSAPEGADSGEIAGAAVATLEMATRTEPTAPGPEVPAGYGDGSPAPHSVRPPRREKTESDRAFARSDEKVSFTKRIAWICIGFVPVFLMVLLYFAVRSGLFLPAPAAVPSAAKVVAAEDDIAPAAPGPVTSPLTKDAKAAKAVPTGVPKSALPQASRPGQARTSHDQEAEGAALANPLQLKPPGRAAAKSPKAAADAEYELASPRNDSILAAAVQDALAGDAGALQSIYDRFALGFPGLKGEVTIDLKVDPSGWVLEGDVQSSSTSVELFDQEILRKVLGWKLKAFPGDKPRSVPVALRFPLSIAK